MGKNGLETRIVLALKSVYDSRQERDATPAHKGYQKTRRTLNKALNIKKKKPRITLKSVLKWLAIVPGLFWNPSRTWPKNQHGPILYANMTRWSIAWL